MEYKDYYKILGVDRSADAAEIKRAYRKLARTHHPDVSDAPDAADRFKEVGEAYEVLKDPEKRAAYDQLGANWRAGQDFTPPPDWDGGFQFRGGGFTEADEADFGEFFETLFGGRGARGRAGPGWGGMGGGRRAGFDQHARIAIDLADAYAGARRDIRFSLPEVDESGHVRMREKTIRVAIPKGVTAGQHLRLGGQAGDGAGDLLIEIAFRPHPVFRVDGRDVSLDLPITPWEAALGGEVRMPTPGGEVTLKIPRNARSGQKLRLKGKGLPSTPPGDLYAVLRIVTPPAETEAGRAFYERMAREFPFDPRKGMEA